ncbi:MAG TPA: methyltransferase domain-containing protein [Gemmataceae bacterium]|nr:methyltransferase domain-containing protein [Gemmataceae bacterium]
MNIEIIEEPIRFHLHGISGVVKNEKYGEVGLRLMNEMWQAVKGAKISTTGINHWAYLPDGRMLVGVELRNSQQAPLPGQLEPLEFELQRYMKHVHVGPYQALPQKWKDLKAELAARGEAIGSPSLEVYGHHCDDPEKAETTILIGLKAKPEKSTTTIDRNTFESIYADQPAWDIGRPQKALLDVADRITGSILDSGCGTGENALYFASRGQKVTGIDFLEEPINLAKRKAAERNLTVTFLVKDALTLKELPEVFDNVIDSGLFHVFSDDDRRRYVEGLASVLKPGGRLFLLCFSDAEPGDLGPRRVSRKEIEDAFSQGWVVESIEPSRYEVRPDLKNFRFSDGGPKAWFVVVRRAG